MLAFRRKRKTGIDLDFIDFRKVFDDVILRHSVCQPIQDIADRNPGTLNARSPETLLWNDFYVLAEVHHSNLAFP